jgi:hypothetical protein
MEFEVERGPAGNRKNRATPVVNYVRTQLKAQATPTGRVLFSLGELDDVDSYKYLCVRLQSLGVEGSVCLYAAAVTQMGRQLAYELTPASEIDDMVTSLCIGARL